MTPRLSAWLSTRRWWHRLRGHRIRWQRFSAPQMKAAGCTDAQILAAATQIINRCSCGDGWVFDALIFHEFYIPATDWTLP